MRCLDMPYESEKASEFSGLYAVEAINRLTENVDARFPHVPDEERVEIILNTVLAICVGMGMAYGEGVAVQMALKLLRMTGCRVEEGYE